MFMGEFTAINNVTEVPDDCDFVAFTIYDTTTINYIVHTLMTKSKFVFIDFNELTSVESFNLANKLLSQYNNLIIVSTVVSNVSNEITFSGHWFMSPINFYSYDSESSWATSRLLKINSDYSNRPYMFDCLLGRKKNERDTIEYMYNNSLNRDKIFFSYYQDNIKNGHWDFPINNIHNSGKVMLTNPTLFNIRCLGEIKSSSLDEFAPSAAIPFSIYNQSYYSIVSETVAYNDYNFYTEKIAKPILAKRPFVVFAGQNYLKNLRGLGFKTFDNIIDESYDFVADIHQRFSMAWSQVEYLMTQDPIEIYNLTETIRNHNYNLFRSTNWTASAKKLIDGLGIPGIKTS